MEQFDKMLKMMADKEECVVPDGFDERVQAALNDLPSKVKKRRLGAAKTALAAAAVCVLLMGTAFAASPGLRELLADALGGFAPYAHGQKGEAYVIDGMEFRVVSALADDFTVRAYVEARDLEGDRLSGEMSATGMVDVPRKKTGEGVSGFSMSAHCAGYDEETKTALLCVTSWGQVPEDDLTGSQVLLFTLGNGPWAAAQFWRNEEDVAIPVEVEPVPAMTADTELAEAFHAEEVRLSPIGLSVIFKGGEYWPAFAGVDLRVQMTDGTIDAPWKGGQGNFGTYGTETERKVLVWNFREPVDLEQVEGIYVGEDYFPVKGLSSSR